MKEDDDLESAKSPAPVVNTEKKKRRRKKKSGKKMPMASSEDNIDNKDDIEETVKWVEQNVGQPGGRRQERTEEKVNNPLRKLLSIENKNLSAIWDDFKTMPNRMKKLGAVQFFSWFGLLCFIVRD